MRAYLPDTKEEVSLEGELAPPQELLEKGHKRFSILE